MKIKKTAIIGFVTLMVWGGVTFVSDRIPFPTAASKPKQIRNDKETICPKDEAWTEKNIAAWLHVSEKTIHKLKISKKLSNEDLCTMPAQKLVRIFDDLDRSRRPDEPGAAIRFRLQQQSVDGVVKPTGLIDAIAQRKALMAKTANTTPETATSPQIDRAHWIKLGPSNIGGRIRAIYIHPADTNLIFVGSVGGGIWKSTDGGTSWSPVNDFMGNLAVTSIVADPTTQDRVDHTVLYAATGEGFYNIDGLRGYGVFKSTDGGTTWNHLDSTAPENDNDWYYVNRLAVNEDGVLLAATRGAIFTSTDGGESWSKKTTEYDVDDIDFDPRDKTKAIAGTRDGRVYYSTDTGSTWQLSTIVDASWTRVETAYAKSADLLYACVDRNGGEIYKSTDNGATWTYVSNPRHLGNQGWYDNIVWVDPSDENRLVVGGIDLYRSSDAGESWTKISDWRYYQRYGTSVHADHHMILEDPNYDGNRNKRVYFGNDGGIFKTDDITTVNSGSGNDNGWVCLNNGLAITQFYGGAGTAGSKIVGGAQDNGDLIRESNTTWRKIYGGDGGFSAVAKKTEAGKYYYFGEYVYLKLHRSNNGAAAKRIYANLPDAGSNANFIAPFVVDPNNPDVLLAGGDKLWRSDNARTADPSDVGWESIKESTGSLISQIAIAEGNASIVLVGYNDGEIYKTVNGTEATPTWEKIHDANGRMVLSLMIDKDDPTHTFYAGFGGFAASNLLKTVDGGRNWNALGEGDLPEAPVRTIVRHPDDPDFLYVGTEVGVFVSQDGGRNWETDNKGPANVSVERLFWYDDKTLVAVTHGRGMFKYELQKIEPPENKAAVVPIVTYLLD